MKSIVRDTLRILLWIYLSVSGIILLHFGRRILVADSFRIPSSSMSPTLMPGDRVMVNKLLFGPRIYTSLDFSAHAPLHSIRLPGIRDIRPGDVIVFNFPFGYDDWSRIEFRINYVYCKRVVGCPGDRIGIVGGHCWNDRVLRPIGNVGNQERLRQTPDSILMQHLSYHAIPLSMPVWSSRNMGPLTVPARGMSISLTEFNRELYRLVIRYETGAPPEELDSEEYTFTQNWYFALGDNTPDSQDSRYWGFIPESFIVGIVPGVGDE